VIRGGPLKQVRRRSNMEHVRKPRPDSGFDFQAKVRKPFQVVPSLLGSGQGLMIEDVIRGRDKRT